MDGTGKLWDDCFADSRLLFMPPATGALLVLLNRNHNVRFVTYLLSCSVPTNNRANHSSLRRSCSISTSAADSRIRPLKTKLSARRRTTRSSTARGL